MKKKVDIGDDMLDRDGTIVEPDVRASLTDYFRKMHMRETTYSTRSTFFSNRYEDPQPEDYENKDDPVGLKLLAKQKKIRDEINYVESIREIVRSIINEQAEIGNLQLGIVTIPGAGLKNKLTVIYSIQAMNWTLSRLFGTSAPKPNPDDLVVAGVEWGKPGGPIKSIDWKGDGPCNYAYVVRRSVTSFPGWGRKAYMAAVHVAGELGADRGVVKEPAERAWQAIASSLESHPYDDMDNPQTPSPDDDCKIHNGRPILNASYTINGSPPADVSMMLQAGARHFETLQKHGGDEIVKKAKMVLNIEFDTIFREKYKSE